MLVLVWFVAVGWILMLPIDIHVVRAVCSLDYFFTCFVSPKGAKARIQTRYCIVKRAHVQSRSGDRSYTR